MAKFVIENGPTFYAGALLVGGAPEGRLRFRRYQTNLSPGRKVGTSLLVDHKKKDRLAAGF